MPADRVLHLAARGVIVPRPDLVEVASDVDLSRIEPGVVLNPGTRLEGRGVWIGAEARLGTAGPAVVRGCAVGRGVELASGCFEDAVFLDGASFGPSGHARAGTLFEEGASAAHAAGTKQTILLPWATLGSNINFCDALLAGGTGKRDHSEVGSGFIHFNFTPFGPAGDKATASLFGDAVRGVWLREPRIFLGGSGGVVGPVSIGYGTVLAAGSVYRRDRGAMRLVYAESLPDQEVAFDPAVQRRASERAAKSLAYLAQLAALRAFHDGARRRLAAGDPFRCGLVDASVALLDGAARERVQQLERLADGLPRSAEGLSRKQGPDHEEVRAQQRIATLLPRIAATLRNLAVGDTGVDYRSRDEVLAAIPASGAASVPDWVRSLKDETAADGRRWLSSVAAVWLHESGASTLMQEK